MAAASVQAAGGLAAPERRHAVILWAQLRGLAGVSGVLDPRVALALLSEFSTFVADAAAAQGGEALSQHHDSLLAAFLRGNPMQCAQQAVRAAQYIQGGFPAIAEQWRLAHGVRTAVAQGLHLGEIILGAAGARGLEQRLAFGEGVGIAQHLMNRSRAGEFVMSDAMMGALSVENLDLDAEPLPPLEIARRPPIRIYGVLVDQRLDFT
jgi:class 3 adenylate cyclase